MKEKCYSSWNHFGGPVVVVSASVWYVIGSIPGRVIPKTWNGNLVAVSHVLLLRRAQFLSKDEVENNGRGFLKKILKHFKIDYLQKK